MATIVQKYGGTSVATVEKIKKRSQIYRKKKKKKEMI